MNVPAPQKPSPQRTAAAIIFVIGVIVGACVAAVNEPASCGNSDEYKPQHYSVPS